MTNSLRKGIGLTYIDSEASLAILEINASVSLTIVNPVFPFSLLSREKSPQCKYYA